jgi:regulator of protease activity HflC (stomatin/prohibitin superfamily)
MSGFIFGIVLLVLSIGAFGAWKILRRQDNSDESDSFPLGIALSVGIIALVGGLISMSVSFVRIVPTNTLGIVTEFNKPTGEVLSNGWHLTTPWTKIHKFDAAQQFMRFEGTGNNDDVSDKNKKWPAVHSVIANNASVDVELVVTWRLRVDTGEQQKGTVALFQKYRTFDRMTENYVKPLVNQAVQEAFADVNPLLADHNPTLSVLSTEVLGLLRNKVDNTVHIESVQLSGRNFDAVTTSAINAQQAQIAATKVAEAEYDTNVAQSKANEALAKSIADTPDILVSKCLDIANEQNNDPGLCMLGSGSGAPVIVDSTR